MNEVEPNKKYTRVLPVDLLQKVVAQKGLDLASVLAEIEGLEADQKTKSEEFKGLIADRKKVVLTIRRAIDTGTENREVECMDVPNVEEGVMETHRLDVSRKHAKRIVSRRPMNLFESAEASPEAQADAEAAMHADEEEKKTRKPKTAKARKVKDPATAEPKAKKAKLKVVKAEKEATGNGKDHDDWDDEDKPIITGHVVGDDYPKAVNL